jgi:hypothetical protein
MDKFLRHAQLWLTSLAAYLAWLQEAAISAAVSQLAFMVKAPRIQGPITAQSSCVVVAKSYGSPPARSLHEACT